MKYSIRFSLNPERHKDGSHAIRMRVSWNSQRVTHYLDTPATDSEWDSRSGMPHRSHRRAMKEIQEKTAAIDRLFDTAHLDRRIPTASEIKAALDINQSECVESSNLLVDVMASFEKDATISGNWSDNTRRNFHTFENTVQQWRPKQTIEMSREDAASFMEYCYGCGLINATVQKFMKQLRWVLRTAAESGICAPSDALNFHPRYRTESENEVVYLSKDELQSIIDLDLSGCPHLDRVRDVFLFCCFSGLRYSDVAKLQRSDIHSNHFRVVTKKTSDALTIELNRTTAAILEKYNSGNPESLALPVISNQRYNEYLKELGRIAGIDQPVRRVWWVRSERHEETVPKWQVLTSHCGRKTFVVSALTLGIASEVVMKWTGHKDHETMKPYIAIADELKKQQMTKFDNLLTEI